MYASNKSRMIVAGDPLFQRLEAGEANREDQAAAADWIAWAMQYVPAYIRDMAAQGDPITPEPIAFSPAEMAAQVDTLLLVAGLGALPDAARQVLRRELLSWTASEVPTTDDGRELALALRLAMTAAPSMWVPLMTTRLKAALAAFDRAQGGPDA